jgi:hypothetical protein
MLPVHAAPAGAHAERQGSRERVFALPVLLVFGGVSRPPRMQGVMETHCRQPMQRLPFQMVCTKPGADVDSLQNK